MHKRLALLTVLICTLYTTPEAIAQVEEGKTGAWYMYMWNTTIKESSWGFQGDIQYRNWNVMGDLEQLLLRGGATYQLPDTRLKFTLGYAYILSGEPGSGNATTDESRIYQEALLPHTLAKRLFLTHRFRYEQRFVQDQDFRTRYRYALFINIPLNRKDLKTGAVYLSLYDELFINGQRDIGNGNTVSLFDRNRLYGAIGYSLTEGIRIQAGYMQQSTENWSKGQLQLNVLHKF